jgi:TP901 family phage tail tape measure protein
MSEEIGTSFVRILPDTTGLNARLGAYFNGPSFGKMGKVAGGAIAAGIAAGGIAKVAYDIGEQFDTAFDKIRVQTGATGKELGKLEGNFKSVLKGVPTDFDSASTAVSGLNQRLGLTGKPLVRLSKQMTELSRITDTDLGGNIQSVTRLFGDWSIKTGQQTKTLDKLFRASQETGIQVSDLADSMVQFGSPLRQLGLDFDTSAAMFSRFEKEGVNVQTLMPGLRMALKNFSAPTDDLSASFDKLGISLKQGPSAALADVFEQLKQMPTDLKANALAFQVFGARAGPDMAAAVREGRFELDDLMKSIETGKDTIRGAGKDTMDFGESWTMLKNNFMVAVEPAATAVFQTIGDGMRALVKAIPDIKRFFRTLGDNKTLNDLGDSFAALGDGIKNVWEDVIMPIVRLIGPQIVDSVKKIAESLKGAIDVVAGILTLDFGRVWDGIKELFGGIGGWFVDTFKSAALLVLRPVKMLASALTGPIKGAFGALKDAVVFAFDKILGAMSSALGIAGDIADEFSGVPIIGDKLEGLGDAAHGAQSDIDAFRESLRGDSAEQAKKKALGAVQDAIKAVGKAAGVNADDIAKWQKKANNSFDDVGNTAKDLQKTFDKAFDFITDDTKKTGDSLGAFNKRGGKELGGVGKSVGNLGDVFHDGIGFIGSSTDEMLKKLKVGTLNFNIKDNPVKNGGNFITAQTGAIVPGNTVGDSVPLFMGNRHVAMVEPGELVSVANKKATAALMKVNSAVPRFAGGGVIEQALGPYDMPPVVYDPNHAGSNSHLHLDFFTVAEALGYGHKMQGMGWTIGEYTPKQGNPYGFGPITTQHQSPAHYDGTGFDANTAADETRSEVEAVVRLLGGGSGGAGAVVERIKRVLISGPNGPLKSGGQKGLDKVRNAANAYLQKQAPKGVGTGVNAMPGPPIKSLPKNLQKWNQQYPYDSSEQMPVPAVQALAAWQGLPSWFWKIAIGESNFEPGAVGHDPGGTTGYGLYQETTSFADPYLKALGYGGDYNKWLNPVINTMSSKLHFDAAASQIPNTTGFPWVGTSGLQRGGLLRLKGGSKKKSDVLDPFNFTKGAGDLYTSSITGSHIGPELKKVQRLSKKLAGQMGAIAKRDEEIDIFDRFANVDGDFSEDERLKELGLNYQLYYQLLGAKATAKQGSKALKKPMLLAKGKERALLKTISGRFSETLTDLTGVTGHGGRIFDTYLQLLTLGKAPDTSSSVNGISISQLSELKEAFDYGVLNQLPTMHTGGPVPGPQGADVPIMAQAGEYVLSREQLASSGPQSEDEWALTIDNWEEGTGRIRRLARGEINTREAEDHRLLVTGAGV